MEEKRKLPSWMIGGSMANSLSKPLDVDVNDVITKEEVSVVIQSTKPKAKGVTRKHKKEVCLLRDEKSFLVKCGTKRKKRGFVEKDVIKCHDQEVVVEKRKHGRVGRRVEESDPSRKKKEKNYELEESNENQAPSRDEEDEDLTMDDLLSIAKEFVENDKSNMGHQKPSSGQHELKSKDTRSSIHEETASHHDSIENKSSKVTLADPRMTGDPAQDMLDLFLGPLLKKPIVKEDASSIKDIILTHEVKNQQQDVISNKPVTLTKKKSSLRDAVAMLLD